MIDVHCHILPGIDDGSDSLRTSLFMAAQAADDGVECIVCTPHIIWEGVRDEKFIAKIWDKAGELQNAMNKDGIPITLFRGAEVLLSARADASLPHIQGTNYSLVEFYFEESAEQMNEYLESAVDTGTRVVIAHPERYIAVQKDRKLVLDWYKKGYYLQINKGSLSGQFGIKAKKLVEWMLKNHLADLMGSDAHNMSIRTTRMSSARMDILRHHGSAYTELLTRRNALRLLRNEELERL